MLVLCWSLILAVDNTLLKGAVSKSGERWLIVDSHSKVVEYWRFELSSHQLSPLSKITNGQKYPEKRNQYFNSSMVLFPVLLYMSVVVVSVVVLLHYIYFIPLVIHISYHVFLADDMLY